MKAVEHSADWVHQSISTARCLFRLVVRECRRRQTWTHSSTTRALRLTGHCDGRCGWRGSSRRAKRGLGIDCGLEDWRDGVAMAAGQEVRSSENKVGRRKLRRRRWRTLAHNGMDRVGERRIKDRAGRDPRGSVSSTHKRATL